MAHARIGIAASFIPAALESQFLMDVLNEAVRALQSALPASSVLMALWQPELLSFAHTAALSVDDWSAQSLVIADMAAVSVQTAPARAKIVAMHRAINFIFKDLELESFF